MMKPSTYYQVLINSLTKTSYYFTIIRKKKAFSFRFFITSMIILGITLSFKLYYIDGSQLIKSIEEDLLQVEQYFPNDLAITWNQDELRSYSQKNPDEWQDNYQPIRIKNPSFIKNYFSNYPKYFATYIDTEQEITSLEDSITKPNLIIISRTHLYLQNQSKTQSMSNDDNNDIKVVGNWLKIPLKSYLNLESQRIDKTNISQVISSINKWLIKLYQDSLPLVFFITPTILIFYRLTSLINVFFLFFFIRLSGSKLRIKHLVKISFHTIVISEIVNQIANLIYQQLSFSVYSLSYFILTLFIITIIDQYDKKIRRINDKLMKKR